MDAQKQEFDSLRDLLNSYKNLPPIVDDDYPECRHYYERNLLLFVEALKQNRPHLFVDNSTLSFEELRKANESRCKRWHPGGIKDWSISDWAVATAGELGEMCNAIKKLNRILTNAQNINLEEGRSIVEVSDAIEKIGREAGDTQVYLDLLCQRIGVSLEEYTKKVFNQKSVEYGFSERL